MKYSEILDSLSSPGENDRVKLLSEINDDISDAFAKEKINQLHYTLLK
jgi:hypothetical protein